MAVATIFHTCFPKLSCMVRDYSLNKKKKIYKKNTVQDLKDLKVYQEVKKLNNLPSIA